MTLEAILAEVVGRFGVSEEQLRTNSKTRRVAEARGALCFVAVRELGYNVVAVARMLGITPSSVSKAVQRGEASLRREPSNGNKC